MKEVLLGTLNHVLELAVCLIGTVVLLRYFSLGNDESSVVIGVAVNALVKFARTSPLIPIPDYTRPKE